jgi:hypothetical protein
VLDISSQGYILSGIFALIGVVLGSTLTFSQQLYLHHTQKKDLEKVDFRNERKALYIELIRVIKSSIFAEAYDDYEDKERMFKYCNEFLIAEGEFIRNKSMYMQLYASRKVSTLFRTCAKLANNYIGAVMNEKTDKKEIDTLRCAIGLCRNETISLIKKELGLTDI